MSTFAKTSEAETVADTGTPTDGMALLAPAGNETASSVPVVVPEVEPAIDRTTAWQPTPENKKAHDLLLDMHTFRRPARSKTERKFINKFLIPLKLEVDKYGNYYKQVGKSSVLWACHTDTVHTEGGLQSLGFDMAEFGISEKQKSNCLGADDTAGVWLMVQMIEAKVPGLYIFHRDEEGGRKGSEWVAKYMSKYLAHIKFAIALDRKATTSIITHQMSRRCCSGDFADSIAAQLDLGYKADDTGSYTDTVSYVDLIPECTNLSVGYYNAHSSFERLDRDHIFKLRDKLIGLDQKKLIATRVAGTKEYKTHTQVSSAYKGGQHYYYGRDDDDYSQWMGDGHWEKGVWIPHSKTEIGCNLNPTTGTSNNTGRTVYGSPANKCVTEENEDTPEIDVQKDYEGMVKLITRNPEAVADILEQFGYGYDELSAEILQTGVLNC